MAKSNAEKQKDFRKRKKKQGLVYVGVWIKPEYVDAVKEFEKPVDSNK